MAEDDEPRVLPLDQVQDPEGEEPGEDEMGGVTRLLRFSDVTKRETLEAIMGPARADCIDRQQDDPRNDPATSNVVCQRAARPSGRTRMRANARRGSQGEENLEHEEQEANKDVCVEPVPLQDRPRWRSDDVGYPSE